VQDGENEQIRSAVLAVMPIAKRPWLVTVSRSPHTGGWVVELEHEASHGLGFDAGEPTAAVDATVSRVVEWLGAHARELNRIAAAPVLVNAMDVMEIRALAHMFNWSRAEVKAVVRMIQRWTLTADEAEWLISFVGHDGPVPTVSWDF